MMMVTRAALLGFGLMVGSVAGCSSPSHLSPSHLSPSPSPSSPSSSSSSSSSSSTSARVSTTVFAKRYLAIATPANRILDRSFDALGEHHDDPRASAVLLARIAKTEHGFDRALLALTLPSPMTAVASELVHVNEARADLTAQAVRTTSVAGLRRVEVDLNAMNVPVESQVGALRRDLGLPPADTD